MVTRAISNSILLRGQIFDESNFKNKFSGQKTYLLYPSHNALDCQNIALDSDSTVVVLDGTWDEAGKILHRNQFLKELPCLSFKNTYSSNYKIRKQPKNNYLSTIESIAYLLKLNVERRGDFEQSAIYDRLFEGFSKMVEIQAAYVPRLKEGLQINA